MDVNLSIMDIDYQCLVVRLYKLDVDYQPLIVRLLGLDVDYHCVDIDVQRPLPNVPYIRTMSHSVAPPFMHAKPYRANHNPHGLFAARAVASEPTPWLITPCCSLPDRAGSCRDATSGNRSSSRVLERLCRTHLWGASIQGGAQQCKNRNTMPLLHGLRPEGQKTSNILNCTPSIAVVSSSPQYCENMSDQVKVKRRTKTERRILLGEATNVFGLQIMKCSRCIANDLPCKVTASTNACGNCHTNGNPSRCDSFGVSDAVL